MDASPLRPPPPWSMLREAWFGWDLARSAAWLPELARQPRGNGEPLLVLPGLTVGDGSTVALRAYLGWLGYRVHGWGLGANDGDVPALVPRVVELVERVAEHARGRVRLVGWSLGGTLAREVARERPERVERVVTLGTPVVGGPKYTVVGAAYRRRGLDLDEIERAVAERDRTPIRVPITAIYSKGDGVVAWRACIDRVNPDVEHVEVQSSHAGLGFHGEVWGIVAQRMARRRVAGA